jgi:carboxylesterase type B
MGYLQKPFVTRVNDRGYVKGVEIVDSTTGKPNCRRFGGVPYAQPITSKQQRWRRPQALPEDLRYGAQSCSTDYTGLSAECPQGYGGAYADKSRMSEDCLQCNIWVPIGKAPEKGWPVWVYIRGFDIFSAISRKMSYFYLH